MSSDDGWVVPAVVVPAVVAPDALEPAVVAPPEADSNAVARPANLPANRYVPEGYSVIATTCWLVGSLTILVLAAVMSIGTERRVFLPGLDLPIPELCTLKSRMNIDCPGCGMTRSFIHFAHGRFLDGIRMNPASLLVFLFVAMQVPAAVTRFMLGKFSRIAVAWTRWNEVALIVMPSVAFVQWIIRLSIGVYT